MKLVKEAKNDRTMGKVHVVEFSSISDFLDYITNQPLNDTFTSAMKYSQKVDPYFNNFCKTENYTEAVDMLTGGWSEMAARITKQLNTSKMIAGETMCQRNKLSVEGFQAVVPMYLNNQPNAMFSRQMVPVKQKVVTITKNIGYASMVNADTIVEESIKCLRIVNKIEQTGVRVNLNIVSGSNEGGFSLLAKIRIKSASERLNISKVAFPLVHPSMLRRLIFRLIEKYPEINRSFIGGYGRPIKDEELKRYLAKDEYLLPSFVKKDINKITKIDDLWEE